ncbi:MAG: DNA-3-methyladenine glycosylase I [Promethearchaeota archaeon]|jgi:3-methyladenine DNA glycosylase Tag
MYQKVEPPRKKPKEDKGYFEILSKAVFNAGFSYRVVDGKWEGIKEVFEDFEPENVSKWTVDQVSKAMNSPKVIRNSRKINAIVSNAKEFLKLCKEYGSFENYLKSFRDAPYEERQKILSKKFKWLGPTGAHFFLWSVAEEAPPCEQVIN